MNATKIMAAMAAMFLTTVAMAQDARYELKSGAIKIEMTTQGLKMAGMQYFDDYGRKDAALVSADMPMGKIEIKTLQFGDTLYSINLTQKMGQKVLSPMKPVNYMSLTSEMVENYKIKEVGEETVAGKLCKKYTIEVTEAGQTVNGEVSVWKGIVLKSVMKLGMIEISNQTAIEVQENVPVEPSMFEIPAGINVMNMN